MLGTPSEREWPDFPNLPHCQTFHFAEYRDEGALERLIGDRLPPTGLNLLRGLLAYDPEQRLTARQALNHPFFTEPPLPKHPSMFPSWPSKSRGDELPTSGHTPDAPTGHQTDSSID